jgi:hypothetical protein
MTQSVLKTHGICLMMYFKNNWNASPFFLLHGYFRRKKIYSDSMSINAKFPVMFIG